MAQVGGPGTSSAVGRSASEGHLLQVEARAESPAVGRCNTSPALRSYRRQASEGYAARAAALEGSSAGPASSSCEGRCARTRATTDYAARAAAIEDSLAGSCDGLLLDAGRAASTRSSPARIGSKRPQSATPGREEEQRRTGESNGPAEITTVPSAAALSSVSVRVLGSNPGLERQVTREELMEQGVPVSHASARVVRQHEQQMLAQHFRIFLLSFILLLGILLPFIIAMFMWLAVEWIRYRETECDVPLQTWCYVVNMVLIFNSFFRNLLIKKVCGYDPAGRDERIMDGEIHALPTEPLRVKLFNASILTFVFLWNILGLYWVSVSGSVASDLPSCREAAPGLWQAVRAYAATNLCFTVVIYIYLIGVIRILAVMMRAGMLRTDQAAPPGSFEANTERIDVTDPLVQENKTCSICLEDFSDTKDIVKTKVCSHVFHKRCLSGWLKVQRGCPLCRRDLGFTSGPGTF